MKKFHTLISAAITGIFMAMLSGCRDTEPLPKHIPISADSLTELATDLPVGRYYDLHFVNDSVAYMVGQSGYLVKTINGCKNWEKLTVPTTNNLIDIDFFDELNGIVIGNDTNSGIILSTKDGGNTWTTVKEGKDFRARQISIPDNQTAYILNDSRHLFKTEDGGLTWQNASLPEGVSVTAIKFKNKSEGVITAGNGEYYITYNGAFYWEKHTVPVSDSFREIFFVDEGIVFYGQGKTVHINKDGKTRVASPPQIVSKIYFINSDQSILVGQHYPSGGFFSSGLIALTNNFWNTWSTQSYGGSVAYMYTTLAKKNQHEIIIVGTGFQRSTLFSLRI